MIKMLKILVLVFCFLTGSANAYDMSVDAAEARNWANTKGQELLKTIAESNPDIKYAKLDKMMMEDVNLDYISKFVIGKYARMMTQEQKERYNNLFYRYALSLYKLINISFDTSSIDFSIDEIVERPRFTIVNCSVNTGKIFEDMNSKTPKKILAKFKLIRSQSGRIQAIDVEISDVSLVIEYRKQFYKMIKDEDEDINWFLDKLEERVKANEKVGYTINKTFS